MTSKIILQYGTIFIHISIYKRFRKTLNILEGLLNKKQIIQIKKFIRSKEMSSFYFDLDIIADIIINSNKNNEIDLVINYF